MGVAADAVFRPVEQLDRVEDGVEGHRQLIPQGDLNLNLDK